MRLTNRLRWAALALAPAAISGVRGADADEPPTVANVLPSPPRGVHLGHDGRYRQDLCDHSLPFFCLSERLLPEDWLPGHLTGPRRGRHGHGDGHGTGRPPGRLPDPPALGGARRGCRNRRGCRLLVLTDSAAYRLNYGLPPMPRCPVGGTGGAPISRRPPASRR